MLVINVIIQNNTNLKQFMRVGLWACCAQGSTQQGGYVRITRLIIIYYYYYKAVTKTQWLLHWQKCSNKNESVTNACVKFCKWRHLPRPIPVRKSILHYVSIFIFSKFVLAQHNEKPSRAYHFQRTVNCIMNIIQVYAGWQNKKNLASIRFMQWTVLLVITQNIY